MSTNASATTTRLRIKEPVYTSDKRAKFTQKESKKWIRCCTVIGYIFFVSLPAISLSIYYIWIWDPNYIGRFPPKIRTVKTDYSVRPKSTVRQGGHSRYNQNVFKQNNNSRKISKNPIRNYLYPPFTKATEQPLKVSNKISQQMESSNTADIQLKMKPNNLQYSSLASSNRTNQRHLSPS